MRMIVIFLFYFLCFSGALAAQKNPIFKVVTLKPESLYYIDSTNIQYGSATKFSDNWETKLLLIDAFAVERQGTVFNVYKAYDLNNDIFIFAESNNIIEHRVTLFDSVRNFTAEEKGILLKFIQNSKDIAAAEIKIDSLKKEQKIREEIRYTKQQGLAILLKQDVELSDLKGFEITVINLSSKTIKYITFSAKAFNPVNDIIPPLRKSGLIATGRGVGPIKPFVEATYEFDNLWYSGAFDRSKITQIFIQYMDGTAKTLVNIDKLYWSASTISKLNNVVD